MQIVLLLARKYVLFLLLTKADGSKQELGSFVMSIISSLFAGFVHKLFMTKLFSVTSVNFGFISNVMIIII